MPGIRDVPGSGSQVLHRHVTSLAGAQVGLGSFCLLTLCFTGIAGDGTQRACECQRPAEDTWGRSRAHAASS